VVEVNPALPRLPAAELLELARSAGFPEARLIRSARLPAALRRHRELRALGEGCYLMTALSCYRREPADLSVPGDPHALIAPFSRRDYYREAVGRLKPLLRIVSERSGIDRRRARIFCNSRLPEKPLAVASGLGFMGRNCLVISSGLGSLFVIAGVFLPLEAEGSAGAEPPPGAVEPRIGAGCGSCRACQDACPVGALARPGFLDEERCLQALAARPVAFSEQTREAWGTRLYGCQSCQEVCPYNQGLREETETTRGELGPSLSIRMLLRLGAPGLKELLRGTPMGMSWIQPRALLRNALVAGGHSLEGAILADLEPYRRAADPVLREAAEWSARRLGRCESGCAG
jgi:epoxyqueuosine reductase